MKTYIFTVLFGLALTLPSVAESNQERLTQALMGEWVAANCEVSESVRPTITTIANTVINGSDPAEVERLRLLLREHLKPLPTVVVCAQVLDSLK